MAKAKRTNILVADDDADLRDILRSVLEPAGFSVSEASDGQRALETIQQQTPDLVILDYMMPYMTGPQVCSRLRQDVLLRHVPIIMLTGKSEVQDKVDGINAGADDYLIKPFEPKELLARVQMVLRRSSQDLDANPLTRLPGNISIQRELERRLGSREPLAVGYADLDRFKAFNDYYGFKRGDEVILKTAHVLLEASKRHGTPQDFVGHIGGDDFLFITTPQQAPTLCETIIHDFDAAVSQLYDESDLQRGYLLQTNRQGQTNKVPLLSISIALVTNEKQSLTHPGEVAKLGAELKAYAKQFDRSIYVTERRKGAEGPQSPSPNID